jgi:glycolate oxidase
MEMPRPNPAVMDAKARIVARLRTVLPDDAVIADPVEARAYECDGLSAYRCPPLAVTLPRTTDETAAILRICHDEGVPVVPIASCLGLPG